MSFTGLVLRTFFFAVLCFFFFKSIFNITQRFYIKWMTIFCSRMKYMVYLEKRKIVANAIILVKFADF